MKTVPIELLRCPVTGQTLRRAEDHTIRDLHARLQSGALRTRSGEVADAFEEALITADGAWAYPIRSGIPVMLATEALPTGSGI